MLDTQYYYRYLPCISLKNFAVRLLTMSATGKQPKNIVTVSYIITEFYHKDVTIATI